MKICIEPFPVHTNTGKKRAHKKGLCISDFRQTLQHAIFSSLFYFCRNASPFPEYQNCSKGPPAEMTGGGSLLNHPSCSPADTISQGTGLNWTDHSFNPFQSIFQSFMHYSARTSTKIRTDNSHGTWQPPVPCPGTALSANPGRARWGHRRGAMRSCWPPASGSMSSPAWGEWWAVASSPVSWCQSAKQPIRDQVTRFSCTRCVVDSSSISSLTLLICRRSRDQMWKHSIKYQVILQAENWRLGNNQELCHLQFQDVTPPNIQANIQTKHRQPQIG